MFAGIVVLLTLAAFGVQLLFCFIAGKRCVRGIPLAVILAGELICAAVYAACVWTEKMGIGIYGGAFAAYIYGLMLLMMLAGALTAWLIWGIINFVQKKKK